MLTDLGVRQVKASRKRCRCIWCGEWIEAGDPKTVAKVLFDGEFQSNNYHPECETAVCEYFRRPENHPDDGFEAGMGVRQKPYAKDEREEFERAAGEVPRG